MGLSVAFYFKASDTSNQFYDNSYKFTKEMAEILGTRIEAGFGERLRHLDEGYSGIRDRFDNLPKYGESVKTEIKIEEDKVKMREQEQHALIEGLAQRAQLDADEKQDIFRKLAEKNAELELARSELRHLQGSTEELSAIDYDDRKDLLRYIAIKIDENIPSHINRNSQISTLGNIEKIYKKIYEVLPRDAIRDLKLFNFLDEESNLTHEALMQIRNNLKHLVRKNIN